MNSDDALSQHSELFDKALELLQRKRKDYSVGDDPFRNFRGSANWGVEPWKGAAIRLNDKLVRFRNLAENGGQGLVQDESIQDTIIDILNYTVIMYQLWQETQVKVSNVATTEASVSYVSVDGNMKDWSSLTYRAPMDNPEHEAKYRKWLDNYTVGDK